MAPTVIFIYCNFFFFFLAALQQFVVQTWIFIFVSFVNFAKILIWLQESKQRTLCSNNAPRGVSPVPDCLRRLEEDDADADGTAKSFDSTHRHKTRLLHQRWPKGGRLLALMIAGSCCYCCLLHLVLLLNFVDNMRVVLCLYIATVGGIFALLSLVVVVVAHVICLFLPLRHKCNSKNKMQQQQHL